MFKNILVTVDLQDAEPIIIEHASELAKKFDSKIWLVHIAAPEPDFVGYGVGPQYIRDFRADELKEEHQALHQMAQALSKKGIETEPLLIAGATIEMLETECEKLNIDLICIGHHKHNWIQKLLGNHTDFSIIDQVKIPVLTIPV